MKPLEDYSWVRGVNYNPKPADQARRELAYGKRVNLNQVRFWCSPWAYQQDKEGYIEKLRAFIRVCHECGYGAMPILFNGNGLNPSTLEPAFRSELGDEYAAALVNALKDEPGLFVWDIMNEPCCNPWIDLCEDPAEKEARMAKTFEFVKYYCEFVKKIDPDNAITVGHTTAYEIRECAAYVDVISFHDYNPTRATVDANFSLADEISRKYGKPVMQTETGCLARSNPYDVVLQACDKYKMGWYLFELMIFGRCDSEHGIFYPDGTVRDPGTIAAMMGCYRNRNEESIIVGLPNREGHAQRALDQIKAALTEYTCDAFDYRRSSVENLLEAAEYAANLLECCDLIPMAVPPTAKINTWRAMEKPPLDEVRKFVYDLALRLKEVCQIL